jgi:hypothetical protein
VIIKLLLVAGTLVPLSLFVKSVFRLLLFQLRGQPARARIKSFTPATKGGKVIPNTVVQFTTADQIEMNVQTILPNDPGAYRVDQDIEILYDKTRPEQFILNTAFEKYIDVFLTGLFTILALIITITCWNIGN